MNRSSNSTWGPQINEQKVRVAYWLGTIDFDGNYAEVMIQMDFMAKASYICQNHHFFIFWSNNDGKSLCFKMKKTFNIITLLILP